MPKSKEQKREEAIFRQSQHRLTEIICRLSHQQDLAPRTAHDRCQTNTLREELFAAASRTGRIPTYEILELSDKAECRTILQQTSDHEDAVFFAVKIGLLTRGDPTLTPLGRKVLHLCRRVT